MALDGDRFPRKVGDVLRLILNIGENTNDLFVRATLIDQDDNEIDTVNLPNTGSGLYEDHNEVMPDVPQLKALYEVFSDSGFTNRVDDFPSAIDYFERDTLVQDIIGQVGSATRPPDLVATVEQDDLNASVEDAMILEANVERDDLVAVIDDDDQVNATTSSEELNANLEC